jgi:RNA polymerase sigma-70 factor (ECF subfamily)
VTSAYVDDVLLVDRCKTGEVAATRELFRRHRHRVHASLYRILGSNRDMEDIMQEAFLQVFKSLGSWRADASLATWIDRIAVRVAYRAIANRRRVPTPIGGSADDEPIATLPSVNPAMSAGGLDARAAMSQLYAALDQLPAGPRVAFALFALDGRSIAEVAEMTNATITATKLRIWRARRALHAAARQDPRLAVYLPEAV